MLPPGHIAAGYLLAKSYETIFHPNLSSAQSNNLLWVGAVSGFIPDIDMFFAFFKIGAWRIDSEKADHRTYFTHYPLLWFLATLCLFIIGRFLNGIYIQSVAIVIFLGTFSHLFLDSLDSGNGIKWLWPLSEKLFTFKRGHFSVIQTEGFFPYWISLVKMYVKKAKVTAITEIVLVIIAIMSLFVR